MIRDPFLIIRAGRSLAPGSLPLNPRTVGILALYAPILTRYDLQLYNLCVYQCSAPPP